MSFWQYECCFESVSVISSAQMFGLRWRFEVKEYPWLHLYDWWETIWAIGFSVGPPAFGNPVAHWPPASKSFIRTRLNPLIQSGISYSQENFFSDCHAKHNYLCGVRCYVLIVYAKKEEKQFKPKLSWWRGNSRDKYRTKNAFKVKASWNGRINFWV